MKTHPNTQGKILPPEPNDAGETRIEQRARELAETRGAGHRFTQEDLDQARRELRGQDLPVRSPQNDQAESGASRDPSEPLSQRGHQIPDVPADDEQDAAARLAKEGVDEAQHDLSLAARRKRET